MLIVAWLLAAYVVPMFVDLRPLATNPSVRLSPPGLDHLFGTDQYGREVFDRILSGASTSIEIGLFTTLLAAAIGITIGVVGGYVNVLGAVLMRINDGLMSFPGALFAIVLVAVFGQGFWQIVTALTITFVPVFARITFGEVLSMKNVLYVRNAVSFGAGKIRIITRHIIPNLLPSLIAQATFVCASAIIIEAGLGFIGAGLAPPAPSWGVMVSEGQAYIRSAWWLLVFPCGAIISLIFGFCLLGDRVSDRTVGRSTRKRKQRV